MLQTICSACEMGLHESHVDVIQQPPPGMLGGSSCRCRGECRDGRYVPPQFANIKAEVERLFHNPLVPENVVLGEN